MNKNSNVDNKEVDELISQMFKNIRESYNNIENFFSVYD